jgi:hypothetical protein
MDNMIFGVDGKSGSGGNETGKKAANELNILPPDTGYIHAKKQAMLTSIS